MKFYIYEKKLTYENKTYSQTFKGGQKNSRGRQCPPKGGCEVPWARYTVRILYKISEETTNLGSYAVSGRIIKLTFY